MDEEKKKKTVIVFGFKSAAARRSKDLDQAVRLGEVSSFKELQNISHGYMGYVDPENEQWLTYPEVMKRFGEEPWANTE
jgi:hypothetical protein